MFKLYRSAFNFKGTFVYSGKLTKIQVHFQSFILDDTVLFLLDFERDVEGSRKGVHENAGNFVIVMFFFLSASFLFL